MLGYVQDWHNGCLVIFSIATETGGISNPFNHRYYLSRIGYLPLPFGFDAGTSNDSSISPKPLWATFGVNTFRAIDLSRAH